MKSITIIATMAATGITCFVAGSRQQDRSQESTEQPQTNLDQAWALVVQVESSGDPYAMGPCGERGIAQIMPIMLKDHLRRTGEKLSLSDVHGTQGIEASRRVFDRHAVDYGFETVEEICRAWHRGANHGPMWDDKGDAYWELCQEKY